MKSKFILTIGIVSALAVNSTFVYAKSSPHTATLNVLNSQNAANETLLNKVFGIRKTVLNSNDYNKIFNSLKGFNVNINKALNAKRDLSDTEYAACKNDLLNMSFIKIKNMNNTQLFKLLNELKNTYTIYSNLKYNFSTKDLSFNPLEKKKLCSALNIVKIGPYTAPKTLSVFYNSAVSIQTFYNNIKNLKLSISSIATAEKSISAINKQLNYINPQAILKSATLEDLANISNSYFLISNVYNKAASIQNNINKLKALKIKF